MPKDLKSSGHRSFGFVTFIEDGVAEHVYRRSYEICEYKVAIDSATPLDDNGPRPNGNFIMGSVDSFGGYDGPMRTYGGDTPIRNLEFIQAVHNGNNPL